MGKFNRLITFMSGLMLVTILLALVPLPVSADTVPPSVSTKNASDVSSTGATLNGKLDFLGAATSVDVTFEWGTSPGSYSDETTPETMSTTGAFSFDLSGLNPDTSYYFMAKAVGDGTGYGGEKSFTTDPPQPSVSTNDATGVGATSATLNMSYDFKDYAQAP